MEQHQRRIKRPYTDVVDDRISALPEPIIHHILSFLLPDIKHLKVTSALSKTWYHLCSSFPYLDFHDSPFNRDSEEHLNYIDETLKRFHEHNRDLHLQIQRLTIPVTLPTADQIDYVDRWIGLVLQHGVVEFNLSITYPSTENIDRPFSYDLPWDVFSVKSIRVARFEGISLSRTFPMKPLLNDSSLRVNLKKLCLDRVVLTELTLSYLIRSCPMIEELSISHCLCMRRLRISNLNKLKALCISSCLHINELETVEIDAPSLQSLEIKGKTELRVLDCPKLTDMDLDYVRLKDLQLVDILSRLSFLRSLRLSNIFSLSKVKVSSDTLNKLYIFACDDLVELDINAPNLLSVEYNGYFRYLASMSILDVPRAKWDVSTGYCGLVNPYTVEDFSVDLRSFISKAKHFDYLYLYFQLIQPFSFEELLNNRVIIDQPIPIIDHLELSIIDVSRTAYPDLIDAVLWSCHPRTLSLWLDHDSLGDENIDFVKCMCKIITRPPARSWIHYLEDVRYVTEDGTENQLSVNGLSVPDLCSSYEIKFIFKW